MAEGTEGTDFLKRRYDLHKSTEVEQATRRTQARTGEKVPQNPNSRIQNYLDRFKEITDRTDPNKRERGVEAVKRILYGKHVIKQEEIPESYFENQRRLYREQGHGDIEITSQMRQQLIDVIIADQRTSLEKWINYFASSDAPYPDWLKYYSIRSILNMGSYDKEKKAFSKRSIGTTSPFPDLNREALAYVLNTLEKKYSSQGIDLSVLDTQDRQELEKLLSGEDFAKLYSYAIEKVTPASMEQLANLQGKWIRYQQGSNPILLARSLEGHGTGWCTAAESTADVQLKNGDFHVFYSLDQNGKPTIPRVAIRMERDKIAEVRGVAYEQNLDQYISPVVEEKLKEFPDGALYEKKSHDMRLLTEIANKISLGHDLTKSELLFLYEADSKIDGFGYQRDPRIEEIRQQRNPQEDILTVFECTKEQIAHTSAEIRADTKAYVGPLEQGIFNLFPSNFEHIYTTFPEGKIHRESLTIGGRSSKDLQRELEVGGFKVSSYAEDILKSSKFTTLNKPENIDLVRLRIKDLGFSSHDIDITTDRLYRRAQELGLELCPAEVGPHLRLTNTDQSMGDWFYIGMKPINDRLGVSDVFRLDRLEDGLWLRAGWGGWPIPTGEWNPNYEFVFRLRKKT